MSRCGECGAVLPATCECTLTDSDTLDVTGAGAPYTVAPKIAVDAGNLISCEPDGLLAKFADRVLRVPRVKVRRTTDQSIATGVAPGGGTSISFDETVYQREASFWSALNPTRITMPFEGVFAVGACVALRMPNAAVDDWRVYLRHNASARIAERSRRINGGQVGVASIEDALIVHTEYEFALNDYFEVRVQHTNSTALAAVTRLRYSLYAWATYWSD